MKSMSIGSTDSITLSNGNYDGVSLMLNLVASAPNVPFVAADVDYSKILIKVVYFDAAGNRYQIIPSISIRDLVCLNYHNVGILSATDWTNNADITLPAALLDAEKALAYVFVPFFGIIGLGGREKLEIEINANSGFLSTVDSSSTIQYDPREAVGIDDAIPVITTHVIQTNQQDLQLTSESAVTRAVYANFDKTGVLLTEQTIANVTVESSLKKQQFNEAELLNYRSQQFVNEADATARLQKFILLDSSVPAMNFKIDMSLIPANIAANQNIVIIAGKMYSALSIVNAEKRENNVLSKTKNALSKRVDMGSLEKLMKVNNL